MVTDARIRAPQMGSTAQRKGWAAFGINWLFYTRQSALERFQRTTGVYIRWNPSVAYLSKALSMGPRDLNGSGREIPSAM